MFHFTSSLFKVLIIIVHVLTWLKYHQRFKLFIIVHVDHPDNEAEESAVNEAAEGLLGFDLPAEPTHVDENEAPQIRYVN